MPLFDLECRECGYIKKDVILKSRAEVAQAECVWCGAADLNVLSFCIAGVRFGEGFPGNDVKKGREEKANADREN